jgi:TPP-dependent pyruvate/acetoin dehydrogenase alpha subunit
MEGDPLQRLAALIPPQSREHIESEAEAEIREAIASAEADPFPDVRELLTDVTGD